MEKLEKWVVTNFTTMTRSREMGRFTGNDVGFILMVLLGVLFFGALLGVGCGYGPPPVEPTIHEMSPGRRDFESHALNASGLTFIYTESPCQQLAWCEDPFLPEIRGYFPRWLCAKIDGVLYRCLWPYAMGSFDSIDAYIAYYRARRELITPCTGVEDKCRLQTGFAAEGVE